MEWMDCTRRWPKNITSTGGTEGVKTMREIFSSILVSFALCLLLIVTPVAADANSFAQAYKDTLTVYGNANMDDIIDENDIEYVQGVIDGTEEETQFADANYDGQIDEYDISQIELIIAGEEDELVILDMANRTVTVPLPVERIVSAAGFGSTRTLIQLGAQDKIVGCRYPTSWSVIWYAAPELEGLPDPGGWGTNFNIEEAVSLEPDVIFISSTSNAGEIQKRSEVPTIAVDSGGDLWVVDELRIIGAITGEDDKARDLTAYTKEKIDEIAKITSEIPDEDKPLVHICGCGGGSGGVATVCRCCGSSTYTKWAGGLNFRESTSNYQVSKEQIIKWDPDIIIIHFGSPEKIEEVVSDPVLQNVNAVKNGRVYSTRLGWGPGGALGQGLVNVYYLAKLFHPDEFGDLDIEKEGNEIMEHLYGEDGMYTDFSEEYNFYRWD